MDCFIFAISALVALIVESSMGRMLLEVKKSLPGVGGGLEQLTGVNGDLELEEEKESILFLDLPWKEDSEAWRLGVQGLVSVVSCWCCVLLLARLLAESGVAVGASVWVEPDDPEEDV